ncbi:MAG TPA: hypothetical protein VLM37_08935 [Fibrobacteraceae bacterium]|nr:hypothetical protein [Fibrobacteraceae bacterium]
MRILRAILLPVSIGLGLLLPGAEILAWLLPWVLGVMVFFAFVGPNRASWRISVWMLVRLLPAWLLLAPAAWLLSRLCWSSNLELAWAMFLVLIAPTGTAAPSVARMRGGNPSMVVSGVLVQHLAVGFLVPLWVAILGHLPASATMSDMGAWDIPSRILFGTLPLILIPLALAWLMRRLQPKFADSLAKFQGLALILWACAVFLVVARTRAALLLQLAGANGWALWGPALGMAFVSLLLCLTQFALGRRLVHGRHAEEGAQILGQKNTILTIWIAGSWFGPWVSLAPLFYVLWQNLYIAWLTMRPDVQE